MTSLYIALQIFVIVAFVTLYIAHDSFIMNQLALFLKNNEDKGEHKKKWPKYLVYIIGSPQLTTLSVMLYYTNNPLIAVGASVIVLAINHLIIKYK